MDGRPLIVAEAPTNGTELDFDRDPSNVGENGTAQVRMDGPTNGHVSVHSNGHARTFLNGHVNGYANGHANGHANGDSNGHSNSHSNGFVNGYTNGHSNGHTNGVARADRAIGEVSSLLVSPLVTTGFAAPGTSVLGSATSVGPFAPSIPDNLYARIGKRLLDLGGAGIALVLLAPVIAAAALLVRMTSRGPVLYKSTRLGRNGRPFTFYKLRSMYRGAERRTPARSCT